MARTKAMAINITEIMAEGLASDGA